MEVFPCPLCERHMNREGTPFDDPTRTQAHITGAHDAAHSVSVDADLLDEIRAGATELEFEDMEVHNPAPFVSENTVDQSQIEAMDQVIDMQARAIGELTVAVERLMLAVETGKQKSAQEAMAEGKSNVQFDLLDGYKEAYEQEGTL
jgi:hypothetical protein